MNQQSFLSQFAFNVSLKGAIGVESEYFLTNGTGLPVGKSPQFLALIANPAWTYELSACQVEHRTSPVRKSGGIISQLRDGRQEGEVVIEALNSKLSVMELADEMMSLDVYPDDERYRKIVASISRAMLIAACRVTGTHFHLGTRGIEEAIDLHNAFARHLDHFVELGDHSKGERISIYKVMAQNWQPPQYESVEHFHEVAREQGFENKPRNCWHLIRISHHGTVELRMFGVTESYEEISHWISEIRSVERECTHTW